MSDSIYSRTVKVVNPQGLHLRPAHRFAEIASKFDSKIDVVKDDLRIDGKSVLSILTLGAGPGSEVSLEGDGPDAQQAVDALAELVESGFGIEESSEQVNEQES